MRSSRIALLLLLLLAVSYLGTRILRFVRIFGPHAGVRLTQDEAALAHNSTTPDPRPQLVPKIIHQIFHNWKDPGNEAMPSDWDGLRQTCIDLNPGWEYKLWTEKISRTFIESNYPWFLGAYDAFKFPVQRVDALRYFLMRHYGGIYIDLDNGCRESLEPLLFYPVWVTDGGHGALSNNILGAQPGHAFYRLLTDSIIPYAWNYPLPYVTISYATGQWFETVIWEDYHARLPSPQRSSSTANSPKAAATDATDINMEHDKPLHRIMMDMRPGADRWVFFTQERGGTWDNWDNHVFGWIGSHLLAVLCAALVAVAMLAAVAWYLLRACHALHRRCRVYRPLPK
ncbi:Mannosyl phosphorylinositol ceramide synthase SUR1 [Pleurostoma richardsiae]|uniref:Mannosyl phosphorylinositol ceramide synthase SUR1 n=1 Tax=Pleurostoma richardsiae TaxID=41990 RepID=A0AA38R868_9PEZI|nr:Mannosyl phosphorylinositol ceramide synthase SUR1 [Pleurostoma richardsiae]